MHFATGRQISSTGGLVFFVFSTGTKACVTAADLIDSDESLHCFTRPMSSCDIKISVVSQCRSTVEFSWLFNIWTHHFSRFFLPSDNLHLLDCAVTWSQLTWTDTDWTCWLAADALVLKHNLANTYLKLTQTAATSYTGSTLPTNNTLLRQRWQNSCILSSRLMTTHMLKKCYLRDFKELPNQNSIDIPMQISKTLFVANSKLSTNAHLVQICPMPKILLMCSKSVYSDCWKSHLASCKLSTRPCRNCTAMSVVSIYVYAHINLESVFFVFCTYCWTYMVCQHICTYYFGMYLYAMLAWHIGVIIAAIG